MSKPEDFKVGQELWYVPVERYSGKPRFITITKIGRTWLTAADGNSEIRVSIDRLCVDGKQYSSPGQCYVDREKYEQKVSREQAWHQLWMMVRESPACPKDISTEQIARACLALGIETDLPIPERPWAVTESNA